MTQVAAFANCQVIQESQVDSVYYSVLSARNICLFQSVNIVKAFQYAEWFEAKKGR